MAELLTTTLFSDAACVANWRFESGALTTDSKGSNTLTNNGAVNGAGRFGGGADLGTGNNYFTTGSTSGVTNTNAVTISFWLKLTNEITSGWRTIFQLSYSTAGNDDVDYIVQYFYNSGSPYLQYQRNRNGVSSDVFNYTVTLGTTNFHHIVLTWDQSTVRAYFDNSLVGSVSSSGVGTNHATSIINIGSSISAVQGVVDDVALFTRALTATEITTLFVPKSLPFLFNQL